jgi:hypothetical protein
MVASTKPSHFGTAGEFFAMSELLLRGWNVAVPVIDVGDDVFVIDDADKTTWRVQVKSAMATRSERGSSATLKAHFTLSRSQLGAGHDMELFYMLMIRVDRAWRFLVIPRKELFAIHRRFVEAPRSGRGRPPVATVDAKNDKLALDVTLDQSGAFGWNTSLSAFLEQWPSALPDVGVGSEKA